MSSTLYIGISLLMLVFAFLSVVLIILIVFLRSKFPLHPLVSCQDAADILITLALIPIYWLLFKYGSGDSPSLAEEILFLVFAGLWVEEQGMHLLANR